MQIVSIGDNLHEMSKPVSGENKKTNLFVVCWKFYPECLELNPNVRAIPPLSYIYLSQILRHINSFTYLTLTTLWATSADDKLIFCFTFPRKQDLTFNANCRIGNNLHEMSKPVSEKNKKNISVCRLLKILPIALQVLTHIDPFQYLMNEYAWCLLFPHFLKGNWHLVLPVWCPA